MKGLVFPEVRFADADAATLPTRFDEVLDSGWKDHLPIDESHVPTFGDGGWVRPDHVPRFSPFSLVATFRGDEGRGVRFVVPRLIVMHHTDRVLYRMLLSDATAEEVGHEFGRM